MPDICSDPSIAAAGAGALCSPPRGWPTCFKESLPLKRFVSRVLKGARCRLTERPPAVVLAEASSIKTAAEGEMPVAERVSAALGWPVIRGFALFECATLPPSTFVARPHAWNVHPSGTWVDLAPRSSEHAQLVLIESPLEAAAAAANVATNATATAAAAATAAGHTTGSSVAVTATDRTAAPIEAMDVSDAAGASAASVKSASAPSAVAPTVVYPPLYSSYHHYMGQASEPLRATEPRRKKGGALGSVGVWHSVDTERLVPYGEKKHDGFQPTRRTLVPGKKGHVRLILRPDQTFELEARQWGKDFDGKRDGPSEFSGRRWPEVFAPLQYGDRDASALHVTGAWRPTQELNLHLQVGVVGVVAGGCGGCGFRGFRGACGAVGVVRAIRLPFVAREVCAVRVPPRFMYVRCGCVRGCVGGWASVVWWAYVCVGACVCVGVCVRAHEGGSYLPARSSAHCTGGTARCPSRTRTDGSVRVCACAICDPGTGAVLAGEYCGGAAQYAR